MKESIPIIIGKKIKLCLLDKTLHLEKAIEFVNNSIVNKWLSFGFFPLMREAEEDWFEKLAKNSQEQIVMAIETLEGKFIGTIGLHQIDWISRRAVLGIMLGVPGEWGKGYAPEAERLIIEHGFKELGLYKICADIYEPNTASLRAAEKAGLKKEAVLKKHIFKHGDWHDIIIMSAFSE